METDKVCKIVYDGFDYILHVDDAEVSVYKSAVNYFKKHYLEYGYTVILDVENPKIKDRTLVTLTPTADGRINVSYYTTLEKLD